MRSGEELSLEDISTSEEETLGIMLEDWQKHPYQNGEEFTSYWNTFVEAAYRREGKTTSPLTTIREDLANRIEEKNPFQDIKFVLYSRRDKSRSAHW